MLNSGFRGGVRIFLLGFIPAADAADDQPGGRSRVVSSNASRPSSRCIQKSFEVT